MHSGLKSQRAMFPDVDGTFELAAASPDDSLDVLAMLHEIGRGENGFSNDAHDLSPEAWPEYLGRLVRYTRKVGLNSGRVPMTTC